MTMAVKIMVDPGHFEGWNRMPNGYTEGNQMWKLSQKLIPKLKAYGFTVGCTKPSINSYPKTSNGDDNITQRGRMAAGYDIELSLHTNAANEKSINRTVVIYPINGKGKDLAAKLGEALQECMGLQKYQIYSQKNSAGTADYYGVIRGAAAVGVPCLIIEHTFHTNDAMAAWLKVDSNLDEVAQCVADTVAEYYGQKKQPEAEPEKESTGQIYRVRKAWTDAKTQIGAWRNLEAAKDQADKNPGYKVYGENGKVVYTPSATTKAFESYIVKITANVLNVRSGPGTNYKINRTVKAGEGYTIVEEQNGWGKLKSGAGWISLEYTKRV
jgi:N-acetylmuramoyl-L-alanine amidase